MGELQETLKNKAGQPIQPTRPGPAEILPHLYLGGINEARDIEALQQLCVTHVLNLAGGEVNIGQQLYEEAGLAYTEIVCHDTQEYDILQHYDKMAELADVAAAATPQGKLFVHCFAGVNRSGTLCIAYHMVTTCTPLLPSAKHCKEV